MSKKPTYEELEQRVNELEKETLRQKRMEELQVEKDQTICALLNAPTETAMLVDLKGTFLALNEVAAQRLGKKSDELLGKNAYDYLNDDLALSRQAQGQKVIRSGKPVQFQDERAGRIYQTNLYPVFDAEERVSSFAIYSRDITEFSEVQKELSKSNEILENRVRQRTTELKTQNEKLGRLALQLTLAEERERQRIAELIHDDLQQQLVAVKIHLENFSMGVQPEKQKDILRINELVIDSLSKTRALTSELSTQVLKYRGLVPALGWLADYCYKTYGLNVELQIDSRVDISREGVKILLFQCVRELLLNATKHASVESVELCMVVDTLNNVRIAVIDKGIGFDPGIMEIGGNLEIGYGLFSIKERLAFIGGCLEVTSALGVGTTCTLIAPLIEGELQQSEEPIVPDTCVSILSDTEQRFRILLVDDHIVMREGLSSLLETQPDIEIVGEAYDGEQAVALARKLRPNVILMDINMPNMNGIEATEIISRELSDLRVIGLSMYDDKKNRSAMLTAGAVDCLPKDGSSTALFAAIRGSGE